MPRSNRIPPPWLESKAAKAKRYLLHLDRLYTSGLKGCESFGAATRGRRLSPAERQAVVDQMKRDGTL